MLSENFDTSDALPPGWTTTGADSTAWEIGTPGDTLFGPLSAYSLPNCAGTNIGGDYTGSQDISLITPAISIPPGGAVLTYRQWRDTEGDGDAASIRLLDPENNDVLIEELLGGIEWNDIAWATSDPLILPDSAKGRRVRIAFRFVSNKSDPQSFAGFYLDDVILKAN